MYDNIDLNEIVEIMHEALLNLCEDYEEAEDFPENEFQTRLTEIDNLSEKLIEVLDLPENRESMNNNAECLSSVLIGIDRLKKIF